MHYTLYCAQLLCARRCWARGARARAYPATTTVKHRNARSQDDLFKPNYYQSLMEFRAQTLQRLQKFAAQRFFRTQDYLDGVWPLAASLQLQLSAPECPA